MQKIFVQTPTGEIEQKDLYKLYDDAFGLYREQFPVLPATDIIHGLPHIFPNTHSVVVPGPPQKFVVRGLERKREERPLCRWNRGQCGAPFDTRSALASHVRAHVDESPTDAAVACQWASCTREALPVNTLHAHVATHVIGALPPNIQALGGSRIVHRVDGPPAKPSRATVAYPRAVGDPGSGALIALLCIRLLFHASFVSAEAAPRADANHFGFPGVSEEDGAEDGAPGPLDLDLDENEGRGRKAFVAAHHLLERVTFKDEVLMGWVNEMIDAGLYGMI